MTKPYMIIWKLIPDDINTAHGMGYDFFESESDMELEIKSMMIRYDTKVEFPFIGEINKEFELKQNEKIEQLKTYSWKIQGKN